MFLREAANIKQQFDGFRNTPFLWEGLLQGLKMFKTDKFGINGYPLIDSVPHIRLGKLIERFVLFELTCCNNVEVLESNIQVFRDKKTVGELDCLMKQASLNIHLEIAFKFYLYDPSFANELDRWIGPNRTDSLVLKLNKLKQKQFPLLYQPEAVRQLKELDIESADFRQEVFFKAQLFMPLHSSPASLPLVNEQCVNGFYIQADDLTLFTHCYFYIPSKLDWLVVPHEDVKWLSFEVFQEIVSELLKKKKSPLCWIKQTNGAMHKFFVVWW